MELNDGLIQQHYKDVYNFALYKLGDSNKAEDVASQTINLFILKGDMITTDNYYSWLRSTCLNYCRKLYDNKKKDRTLYKGLRDNLVEFFKVEHDSELTHNFHLAMESLNELDARSLVLYFYSGQNVKKMSEITGESHDSVRKRIYRIKKKLKAETYKNLGYIATKKIVIPKLHEAIIQFIRRLKKNIENNTIEKMFYYFSKTNISNYKPEYDIQKIKDYEVTLKNGKYRIFIFYHDSQKQINNISFTFYLNEKNQLKISELPERRRRLVKIDRNSNTAKEIASLLKDYPESRNGLIKIPLEIMQRLTST